MSIGTFCLVKNEAPWIAAHILRILPFVDEMVLFDGNSTDGTLEIIQSIKKEHEEGGKVKLFRNEDPKNLQDDYVRLFNECLRSLSTDLAWFLHPDMFLVDPEKILAVKSSEAVALSTKMRSFAGEPDSQLYEIKGRDQIWKSIHRLRNPDLGAHYHGFYGAWNEDVYFREITGSDYEHHGERMDLYPFEVESSGLEILHFSDVRPHARRLDRMRKCLANQGHPVSMAETHPRVTLQAGQFKSDSFNLAPAEYPVEFIEARNKYKHLERMLAAV